MHFRLTTECSLCLHYAPLSSSNSRHCSHSNTVLGASLQSRVVEAAGGEPKMVSLLSHTIVPLFLYSTWYCEMFTTLCGVIQFTLRAAIPDATVLVKETPLTLEGTDRETVRYQKKLLHCYICSD